MVCLKLQLWFIGVRSKDAAGMFEFRVWVLSKSLEAEARIKD